MVCLACDIGAHSQRLVDPLEPTDTPSADSRPIATKLCGRTSAITLLTLLQHILLTKIPIEDPDCTNDQDNPQGTG